MKRLLSALVLTLAVAVLVAGCGGGGGSSSSVTDLGTVKLTDEMKFEPNTFTGKVGKFKVTLQNTGTQIHDFVIPDANVKVTVNPNQTVTKEFEITKEGEYTIECTQPGHKDLGMTGKLTVTK